MPVTTHRPYYIMLLSIHFQLCSIHLYKRSSTFEELSMMTQITGGFHLAKRGCGCRPLTDLRRAASVPPSIARRTKPTFPNRKNKISKGKKIRPNFAPACGLMQLRGVTWVSQPGGR